MGAWESNALEKSTTSRRKENRGENLPILPRRRVKTAVDRFGRIVVPKELRDRHGLLPGSEVEIEDSTGTITLRMASDLPGLVEKEGILVFRGPATGDLDSSIRSHREERLQQTRCSPCCPPGPRLRLPPRGR
jgi:AbrB family looped-hinge helix DNA binding protein